MAMFLPTSTEVHLIAPAVAVELTGAERGPVRPSRPAVRASPASLEVSKCLPRWARVLLPQAISSALGTLGMPMMRSITNHGHTAKLLLLLTYRLRKTSTHTHGEPFTPANRTTIHLSSSLLNIHGGHH